jgi:hypothetical protein
MCFICCHKWQTVLQHMSFETPNVLIKWLTLLVGVQRSHLQTQKLTTQTEFFHFFASVGPNKW